MTTPSTPNPPPKPPLAPVQKQKFRKRAFRAIERFFAILGLIFLCYHLAFEFSVITTESMASTLKNGDIILQERISYWFRKPARFEIVAYNSTEGLHIMKRVVGFPQEQIGLDANGWVLIDDKPLERPASLSFLKYHPYGNFSLGKKVRYDLGYYVLGDDSRDSLDSRFEGPLIPSQVQGRAWLCVWPLSRFRFLSP